MKKKAKLIATLSSLGLALAMMVFAVYAATSVTFKVTTNVSFEATKHVQATIVGKDTGAIDHEPVPADYTVDALNGGNQTVNVDGNGNTVDGQGNPVAGIQDVEFKGAELTATNRFYGYKVTITNNDDENALPIDIETPSPVADGKGYTVTFTGDTKTEIPSGESHDIICIVEVTDLAGNKVEISVEDLTITGAKLGSEDASVEEPKNYICNEALTIVPIDDDTAYLISIDDTKLTNTQTYSAIPFSTEEDIKWHIPEKVLHTDGKEYTIVKIGSSQLYYQILSPTSLIKNIVIPNSVTLIGKSVFYGCSLLQSITIGKGVQRICYNAFGGCTSLYNIEMVGDKTVIDEEVFNDTAFYKDESNWIDNVLYLTSIDGTSKYLIKAKNAISGSYSIDSSTKSIAGSAFSHCESLESLTIPASIKCWGTGAFSACTSLKSINFSNGLDCIDSRAFQGCTNLQSIQLPESIISVFAYAFFECSNLVSVTFGNKTSHIGYYSFGNCTSLNSIIIPNSVTTIETEAFNGCTSLAIYCEAESKPEGWEEDWNSSNRPVYWAGQWSYDAEGNPVPNA